MKRILKFMSSVKLAIVLLIILTLASVLGTLIPQAPRGMDAAEYGPWLANVAAHLGGIANLLNPLQFFKLYRSFWYVALILFFALNIIVCTLTRLSGKLRRASRPRVAGESKSLLALKIKDRFKKNLSLPDARAQMETLFKASRYKVRAEAQAGRVSLLARKRIGGIFGSDVVHVGLLVILAGGILSGLTSVRRDLKMHEGQVVSIPAADFSLRLDKFSMLYYDDGRVQDPDQRQVKSYISKVTVLEGGREILARAIEVNHPLSYKGFNFYQSSYGYEEGPAPMDLAFEMKGFGAGGIEIWARKKSDPAFLKKVTVKVGERALLDDKDQLTVSVIRFLPDFVLGEGNKPETRSEQPNNPAAQIEGFQGGDQVFTGWLFSKYPDFTQMHASGTGGKPVPFSVLEAAKDPGVSLIWIGCALVMAGLSLAFYWPTWEIKAVLEETQGKTDIVLGGLAARSRDAFAREFEAFTADLRRFK